MTSVQENGEDPAPSEELNKWEFLCGFEKL